ncbi:MAG: heme-binding protein [Phycisphaeraceae bacterium]|nr:heme-binding protein [Phycisphaeraceae bacterium]
MPLGLTAVLGVAGMFAAGALCGAARAAQPVEPPEECALQEGPAEPCIPAPGTVRRLGGSPEAEVRREGEMYLAGSARIDTPLPDGYPDPTPPGAIDLKGYPSVRRAEYHTSGNTALGSNVGFWRLFRHIERNEIAMTSPVEMDYPALTGDGLGRLDEWTMSFLYRSADLGPEGEFSGVVVRDTEPVTVVSLGFQGGYSLSRTTRALAELEAWLGGQVEWIRDGDARVFHYNGPNVPSRDRWGEVQIPVRPAVNEEAKPVAGEVPTGMSCSGRSAR